MVKHTQTIRRQIADELFQCVWPFCEIDASRVKQTAKSEEQRVMKKRKQQQT